jgi:hypothetical protein
MSGSTRYEVVLIASWDSYGIQKTPGQLHAAINGEKRDSVARQLNEGVLCSTHVHKHCRHRIDKLNTRHPRHYAEY